MQFAVRRVVDTEEFNAIISQPEILALLAPECVYLDASPVIVGTRNVALTYAGAAAMFEHLGGNDYSGHYFFPRNRVIKSPYAIARPMLKEMFTTYGADAIFGEIPRDYRAARYVTAGLGFRVIAELPNRSILSVLERDSWASSSAAYLV